jgi:phospholipid/cholesterol/gamma-HCH transport system substrate-binding protein
MGRNLIETVMGAVVLMVAAGFLIFAYQSSSMKPVVGYTVNAKFDTVAGLALGSDVRVGGIKVGVVSDLQLDPKTYQAVVTLQVSEKTQIPSDSTAAVVGDGLLGSKYIKIEAGGDDAMLKEGGTIEFTQSSVNLEDLIGKMVFSGGGVDKSKAGGDEKSQAASPNAPAAATIQ